MSLLGGSKIGPLLLGVSQQEESHAFLGGVLESEGGQSLSQWHLERSAEALPAQSACHHRSLQVSHEVCVTRQGSTRLASCDQDEEWV